MEYNLFAPANLPYILYTALGIISLMQLYFIVFIYSKLAYHKVTSNKEKTDLSPVSVIICARNEQENLKTFLPAILQQDYPEFEVIVVNDCSTDDTQWILQDIAAQHSSLRIVEIQEHIQLKHSKKFALTLGIKAAKYPTLLMTDADCQPQSMNWIKEMAGAYQEGKEIILGYSPYFKTKGFLNKLIRFETAHTAMSYLSYALIGNSYMGVGRNLSYKRALFFKGKGFNSHMHIKSGDDDLFVNQNSSKANTCIAIAPDAHVYSLAKNSWKAYYKQKARHSGASTLYKSKHKTMLAAQLLSAVMFYLVLTTCLVLFPQLWYYGIGIYLLRLLCQYIIYSPIYLKLATRDLLLWLPLLDLFYYFYICINGLFNRRKKQASWK